MQQHGHEVYFPRRRIAIKPIMPAAVFQTARATNGTAEGCGDVVLGRIQITAEETVPLGLLVPCVRHGCGGETPMHSIRARRPQRRAVRRARQWIEFRADPNNHGAVNQLCPDIRGVLEGDNTLLPYGRSGITTYRSSRGWIIEALPWAVEVNDGKCRARAGRLRRTEACPDNEHAR